MSFENGKTTLYACMQCLEDITKYIDDFTCGNESVGLNVVEENNPIARTGLSFLKPQETKAFRISRSKLNGDLASVQVDLVVETVKSQMIVKECALISNQKSTPATERGGLRDMICARLAPTLRVFSVLNVLVPRAKLRIITPPSGIGDLPRFCMQMGNIDLITVDSSDQILTMNQGDEAPIKQWDFRGDEDQDIPQAKLLPFLTYVLGNTLIET
jgi:hypothetical protein